MRRLFFYTVLICSLSVANLAFAGDSKSSAPTEQVTSCNFDNGNQVAIRYLPVTAKKSEGFGHSVRFGTVWAPDDRAMVMFNSGPTAIENKDLAAGAYTLYLIPNKNDWTLIVSRETDTKAKYDESKDVARIPMEIGDLPSDHPTFEVFLGKTGPNRCSLRIYWQEKGAFATIDGK